MRKHLKDYFVPHEGNNHRPHSLRAKSMLLFVCVFCVVETLFVLSLLVGLPGHKDFLAAIFPAVLAEDANEARLELNIPELKTNPLLERAAQLKADDMASRQYFAHNTPEGNPPWSFLDKVGYQYESAGENLAVDFNDSYATHKAWMNSPTHRENIVQSKFTEIGIATAEGKFNGHNTIYVVQFFGKPKAVAFVPQRRLPETVLNTTTEKIESNVEEVLEVDSRLTQEPTVKAQSVDLMPDASYAGSDDASQFSGVLSNMMKGVQSMKKIFSSPLQTTLIMLFAILAFIAFSLVLNMFIKIKIQHTDLIAHGVLMIVSVISFSYFNYLIASIIGSVA